MDAVLIGGVEFPEEVIGAHRSGDLVIFVGAGASIGPPSSLPNFRVLAEEIATDAGVDFADKPEPDVLLGKADATRLVDVHARVATRIGHAGSRPNTLHAAIGALAAASPTPRIVTTNYDRHLSTDLEGRGVRLEEYRAPALPQGNDFEGLVYLHGTLTQDSRHLVATDEDFGRAYLVDRWAAQFLEKMFATYTVLFVGYSHSDVVVKYLARALRPPSRRYVLIPAPPSSDWQHLRIQPITYDLVGGSHQQLTDAVQKWADRASMGLLDHRQLVAQLLSAAPSDLPEEDSYLESVLEDDNRVGFFTDHARSVEWLLWAASRPGFSRMFVQQPAHEPLAGWFAHHYAITPEHSEVALGLIRDAGDSLGYPLWSAIGQALHSLSGNKPEWVKPWLALIVRDAPESREPWLEYALASSRWPEDRADALLLFETLTEPTLVFRPSLLAGRKADFDIKVRGDTHWLTESWGKVLAPALPDAAIEILPIMDAHLRRAHRLLMTASAANRGWDPLSFGRSAIEPHQQDKLRKPVDTLIDAARDCLEALLDQAVGLAILDTWAASDVPLLRRIAIHGWRLRTDVSATSKLTWLREHRWLFDHQCWHEALLLLEAVSPTVDPPVADALVAEVLAAPESEMSNYHKFSALSWIARHAPELASASAGVAQIRETHPEYQERDHPDLRSWMVVGFRNNPPPMPPEELHDLIVSDPRAALGKIREFETFVSPFDSPSWNDALALLSSTVAAHPDDGHAILGTTGDEPASIADAVIRGWSAATMDDDQARAVLTRFDDVEMAPVASTVAEMLSSGGRNDRTPTAWHRIEGARELAEKVWDALPGTDPDDRGGEDWLAAAINHPAGWLAEFWLEAISADWQAAGIAWDGLPSVMASRLEGLIAGADDRAAMVQVVLASRLRFLHGADQEWTERVVLPLLDWKDPVRARRAWDGYLFWGRWNDRLLQVGLLDHYLNTVEHLGDFRQEIQRLLPFHLAAVAVLADEDPSGDGWARKFTTAADSGVRTEWMRQVAQILSELEPAAVEHQWERWMRAYWEARLKSEPRALTEDEASEMSGWAVYLTDSIQPAVQMAHMSPAHLRPHSQFLKDLSPRIDRAPTELAALLVHLMKGTGQPFHQGYEIPGLVNSFQAAGVDVTPLAEQALRLGIRTRPR